LVVMPTVPVVDDELGRGPTPADLLPRCNFAPPGTAVTCAVSGGADSLALLVLAVEASLVVTAVHVDHCLRPGSAAEADVVAAAAARFGAGFEARRAPVAPGPNLEARARAARRAALPAGALTGHTADDQAETVVLNLLRGAGLDGLGAMAQGPTKPLLGLRRRETRALCGVLGLEVVEDPTNADPIIRRNRVRNEVLPLLDAVAGRDVAAVLARQAALLNEDAALLDSLAAELDPTDARALAAAPPPLARRALRGWLRSAGGPEAHPPSASAVERVLAVARGEDRATEVGWGWRVRRNRGRLRLEEPPSPPQG
jgi:tRNA(Ile)-lysidine synthase